MAVSHVLSNTIADKTGTVTVWDGATTASVAATNLVRPGDWNSVHNQFYTLSGNTTNASTASGTNVVFQAAGDFTIAGSTGSIFFSGGAPRSSWQFPGGFENSSVLTFGGTSISHAGVFNLPENMSISFLRFPVLMTTNSTTLATTAQAATSLSAQVRSTWNAVIYSLGTGASSNSLISVASGNALWTIFNQISITQTTQYSISQSIVGAVEGSAFTSSGQYSASTSNLSFVTTVVGVGHSNFSSNRWLDIPMATSLSAGPYWLVIGMSTSSLTNNASATGLTQCNVRYSNHFGMSQVNSAFGVMGSSNFTSGGAGMGAGSFSTAGGGTTSGFDKSFISSSASNPLLYFQLIRSA